MKIPDFKTKDELFKWLKENKEDLIYTKKSAIKTEDCAVPSYTTMTHKSSDAEKSTSDDADNAVKVRAIINTTNVMDSHKDVHIPGLWKKSLQENRFVKHLQEHQMSFKSIISDKDDLKAFTRKYSWKDLGVDAEGETEALVFDSNVKRSRNSYMFEQYKDGNVDNHSVGMIYVNVKLAINKPDDPDYEKEYETYQKHIDNILNKDEVEKNGYFWAVYEAKVREGSAVPLGSNYITPTLSRSKDTQGNGEEIADVDKSLSAYLEFLKS